jgi:uncharacterized membrane protein
MVNDLPDQYTFGQNPLEIYHRSIPVAISDSPGVTWTIRSAASANNWYNVCYGNGLFVAVSLNGVGNRVMTSPDGITWTIRASAADNNWWGVCYGNGLFVAVANSGSGNRVMTSPDGITWTIRASAANNNWTSVCYGAGVFVAVAYTGVGNRVMTSPDGITWTIRASAANDNWYGVCFGYGSFVAVGLPSVSTQVMTSSSKTITIDLPVGILRKVSLFFPAGCSSLIHSCLYHQFNQIIPTDSSQQNVAYMTGNDHWFDSDNMFELILSSSTRFVIHSWNVNNINVATNKTNYEHTLEIYLTVERVSIP